MRLRPDIADEAFDGVVVHDDAPNASENLRLNLAFRPWEPGQPPLVSERSRTPFIQLPHRLYRSNAFRRLSSSAQQLLLFMIFQYRGHNNGQINVSFPMVRRELNWGSSPNRYSDAMDELLTSKLAVEVTPPVQHRPGEYALAWLKRDSKPYKKDSPKSQSYLFNRSSGPSPINSEKSLSNSIALKGRFPRDKP